MKKWKLVSMFATMSLAISLVITGCGEETKITAKPVIEGDALDPASWSKAYPEQYKSYLRNNEEAKTDFGGSVPESKFISEPEIVKLFAGYGFSKEYNEDRGHTNALDDLLASDRVNEKTPGSCLSCKTPYVPKLMKEMGSAYYTTPVKELVKTKNVKHAIGCASCHNPETNELEVTKPDVIEGWKKLGIDVKTASQKEMRTLVCAQCHIEYTMKKDTKEIIFPWDNGREPEQVLAYYDKIDFFDWEHPDSKAKMLKAQHPEFETFSTSVHGTAGVSCADCHMPYMTENGKKMSSHWWTSPLKTIEVSCKTCHTQDVDWLKERVINTQSRTFNQQTKAGKSLVEAHEAIKFALLATGNDQDKVKKAQDLLRKGQWHWDWVAAENSRGFHNPVQSMDSLSKAMDYAHQAKEMAESAHN